MRMMLTGVAAAGCVLALGCGTATSTSTATSTATVTPQATSASVSATTPPGGAEVFTAEFLARTVDQLGTATGRTIGSTATRSYLAGRRLVTGGPEVHDRWTDLAYVQAGRATLVSGGKVEGGREESPGEHRGGTIVGGTSHVVGPGDLLIIPAGMPHQYVLAPGDTLRYLTLKVLEGAP